MKRKNKTKFIYCMCLLLLVTGTFAGCDSKKPKETGKPLPTATLVPTKKLTPTLAPTATPEPTPTLLPKSQVPEYITKIYDRYKLLQKFYNFDYSIGRKPRYLEKIEFIDTNRYTFDLRDEKNKYITFYFDFLNKTDEISKSFDIVYFLKENAISGFRDAITATFLVLDKTVGLAQARKYGEQLVDTYEADENHVSDMIKCGDYEILIMSYGIDFLVIYVKHKDEKNVPVDKSLYKLYNYEQMKSVFYDDLKTYITGEVIENVYDGVGFITKIKDNKGKIYNISYALKTFFTIFEPGQQYTFYGRLWTKREKEIPDLALDYFEKLEE